MSLDRVLSQDEIDNVFRNMQDGPKEDDLAKTAESYDFRRPDRIAKDQLRSIHLLHENFGRSLASSLSAYLRAYVIVNLVSVEQLSFQEFVKCMPSPTCMVSLGMRPYDGNAILELNPSLVFPILEMLLGGGSKISATKINRELTEIEQSILEGLYRIVLNDLKESWRGITNIAFTIDGHETEPSLLQVLSPTEAVVAISMEIRVGENSGMMNIGLPSIVIKMLRQKFDQQWSVRKGESTEAEQSRILRLIKPASISIDTRLQGPTVSVEDLLRLEEGDVLTFDYPVDKPVNTLINGKLKLLGQVVNSGRKKAFLVHKHYHAAD